MNRTIFFKYIFLLLLGCCACYPVKTKKPSLLLPMDSVAVLVADSYFLEGEIYVKQREYDIKDYTIAKYDSFFFAHNITKDIYAENVKYYLTTDKFAEKMMNKIDTLVDQRVAALRDSLNVKQ